MTYDEWFDSRTSHSGEKARETYVEITGDDEGAADYSGVIEFPAGFLMVTSAGQFHAICGQSDVLTRDLDEAARFLWDEHSKYEVAAQASN